MAVPWFLCFLAYSLLHYTYSDDRDACAQYIEADTPRSVTRRGDSHDGLEMMQLPTETPRSPYGDHDDDLAAMDEEGGSPPPDSPVLSHAETADAIELQDCDGESEGEAMIHTGTARAT